jgi:hypothetical protein
MMMLLCGAENCDSVMEADVTDLGAGAGRIRCSECGGDGGWSNFAPGMAPPGMKCPDCKGLGYLLVSV